MEDTNLMPSVSMLPTYTSIPSFFCITCFSRLCRSSSLEVWSSTRMSISYLTRSFTAFDQDVHAKAALAFPQLYIRGIRGLEYTKLKFWLYMADGLYQSAVVFFFPYLAWTLGNVVSWNGKTIESLADFGTTVSVAAIFSANTYVGINTR